MRLKSCYKAVPSQWRTPKTILYLFGLELALTVAALALFGIAAPDLYRTKLWQEGSDHGWNSNPNKIIYDYINYRPIHYPLPWDEFTTRFNVIISVLSLFILLVKGIMYITHIFHPILSVLVHGMLVALYAISIRNQAGSDMTDPKHPQPGPPWYITKSCGAPVRPSLKGYCMQAKGAFAISICLIILFFTYLLLSLLSLYPTASHRASLSGFKSPSDKDVESRPWEMTSPPQTAGTTAGLMSPTTPRTMAFNTLSGKAPAARRGNNSSSQQQPVQLRHHISMGDETYAGPSQR